MLHEVPLAAPKNQRFWRAWEITRHDCTFSLRVHLITKMVAAGNSKANLPDSERNAILQTLLSHSEDGKLKTGELSRVADKFKLSTKTISRIWHRAKECWASGMKHADVGSRIKVRSGRKKKDRSETLTKVKDVPFRQRSTLRSLSAAINTPLATLHRIVKEGALKRISNTIKPALTDENKQHRLKFSLSMLQQGSNNFDPMYDTVHVDEKWFNLTKIKQNFYVLPDEEGPERSCQSKRFITKVMFLAAVARPRYDPHRKTLFDGKIGIWPFVVQEPAKRSSKNRAKGTMVTKPVEVNRQVYVKMLAEKVIPAIKAKWPAAGKSKKIKIQQDNARPHARSDQPEILEAGYSDGWSVDLVFQPPNSPDFNVLDLGFFNAIQSLQHQYATKNIDELVAAVAESFEKYPSEKLNDVFLTLQKCMEATMIAGGGNGYKIPHMAKDRLRREGSLPETVCCNQDAIDAAKLAIELQ